MKNYQRYKKQYYLPPQQELNWMEKDSLRTPPIWCSVDLRDGNQALVVPMTLEEKIEFFHQLIKIGFKEIEVGFPAASETEYAFLRKLIEEDLIPNDVTIQVLTQAREHIIKRTFEALSGVKRAIVHVYNSTSYAQREQVFRRSQQEIEDIAIRGAKWVLEYAQATPGTFRFQYSPESFTGTEMVYALHVCNSVLEVWKPTAKHPVIINLPSTVSHSMPHVYANQVAYLSAGLKYREHVILSLHPHNDRGCAVADAEMGLLAGGDRLEGTLFGNGERTGNVDLVTVAMNMYSQGVNPKLCLENMPAIVQAYESCTHMHVYERQPYSGKLVFAAFSGSHQDAIAKGMEWQTEKDCEHWTVPYLPIDPKDIGRSYDGDVIRINSQSGKGGIGYLLAQHYGYELPAKMREDFGYVIKNISDQQQKELSPFEIHETFKQQYVNVCQPICLLETHFKQNNGIEAIIMFTRQGNKQKEKISGHGNGRLDAVTNALEQAVGKSFHIINYHEHALEHGSKAKAVAYLAMQQDEMVVWGAGVHEDIVEASIYALVSCMNRCLLS